MAACSSSKSARKRHHNWTTVEEDNLVTLYESNPVLYNCDVDGYSNRDVRLTYYKEFAKVLGNGITADDIDTRIKSFRSQYPRNKRRYAQKKSGSAGGNRSQRAANLHNRLSFLEPYLRERDSTSTLPAMASKSTLGDQTAGNSSSEGNQDDSPLQESQILHTQSEEETDMEYSQAVEDENSISMGDHTLEDVCQKLIETPNRPKSDSDDQENAEDDEDDEEEEEEEQEDDHKQDEEEDKGGSSKTVIDPNRKPARVVKTFNTRSQVKAQELKKKQDKDDPKCSSSTQSSSIVEQKHKRGRGRPKKIPTSPVPQNLSSDFSITPPPGQKKRRSRKAENAPKIVIPDLTIQKEALDLSFDNTQLQSQSLLKDAPKAYFDPKTAQPKKKKKKTPATAGTSAPAATEPTQNEDSENVIAPSQPATRKRHFPVDTKKLTTKEPKSDEKSKKPVAAKKDEKGNQKSSSKAKPSKDKDEQNDDVQIVDESDLKKDFIKKFNQQFDNELKNQKSEVHMWARLVEAKVNRIHDDRVREKLMHCINDIIVKALDGDWPEVPKRNPSAALGAPRQLSSTNLPQLMSSDDTLVMQGEKNMNIVSQTTETNISVPTSPVSSRGGNDGGCGPSNLPMSNLSQMRPLPNFQRFQHNVPPQQLAPTFQPGYHGPGSLPMPNYWQFPPSPMFLRNMVAGQQPESHMQQSAQFGIQMHQQQQQQQHLQQQQQQPQQPQPQQQEQQQQRTSNMSSPTNINEENTLTNL